MTYSDLSVTKTTVILARMRCAALRGRGRKPVRTDLHHLLLRRQLASVPSLQSPETARWRSYLGGRLLAAGRGRKHYGLLAMPSSNGMAGFPVLVSCSRRSALLVLAVIPLSHPLTPGPGQLLASFGQPTPAGKALWLAALHGRGAGTPLPWPWPL